MRKSIKVGNFQAPQHPLPSAESGRPFRARPLPGCRQSVRGAYSSLAKPPFYSSSPSFFSRSCLVFVVPLVPLLNLPLRGQTLSDPDARARYDSHGAWCVVVCVCVYASTRLRREQGGGRRKGGGKGRGGKGVGWPEGALALTRPSDSFRSGEAALGEAFVDPALLFTAAFDGLRWADYVGQPSAAAAQLANLASKSKVGPPLSKRPLPL